MSEDVTPGREQRERAGLNLGDFDDPDSNSVTDAEPFDADGVRTVAEATGFGRATGARAEVKVTGHDDPVVGEGLTLLASEKEFLEGVTVPRIYGTGQLKGMHEATKSYAVRLGLNVLAALSDEALAELAKKVPPLNRERRRRRKS